VLGELRTKLSDLLRSTIRPEFLNRIDEIVLFKPLLKNELMGIIDIQLKNVAKLLADKNITIEVSKDAKEFILEMGYDVTFGARPLKRTIQKSLINPLSTELLMNKFVAGDNIFIDAPGDGRLHFIKK
jgi:ATP-dependent Clp protease ATP-binding subunit ClpB